ncbi:hypothetical protein Cs7R123_54650 [Catellatospora sp. TT07R-123]|uniref:SRPBCC family protein n=1 Tax=Catellatospora sp. TT07R-123 TaxID=2733863 RepID=UPI001B248301|nr:SRPBCC family protein [Catellatospora sp. TT07R-123]GHJ48123.1 hypothetical protein Cs7R123_54650 [Catellatospora sp. TT07R-123]
MAKAVLEHEWRVDAGLDEVFRHLADPNSYIGLSPLVVTVRDVRMAVDERDRPVLDYIAVERFKFLRKLRWDNPIKVRMRTLPDQGKLAQSVKSPGGVRLESTVELIADGDGTRILERLDLSMPAPLKGFVTGQARSVQLFRAAELARRMARS